MFISSAYAQAAQPAAGGFDLNFVLMMALMFGVMYFLIIRPQQKRAKEARQMVEGLQKGDEVITSGGLLGRITRVGEAYLTVEVASGTEVSIQKGAVQTLLPKGTLKSVQ